MSDNPTPAIDDCHDPASRLTVVTRGLAESARRATIALERLADMVWPIVEELPPGAMLDEDPPPGPGL
jgi:hypothetical protein